jgi:hypothetical protein
LERVQFSSTEAYCSTAIAEPNGRPEGLQNPMSVDRAMVILATLSPDKLGELLADIEKGEF